MAAARVKLSGGRSGLKAWWAGMGTVAAVFILAVFASSSAMAQVAPSLMEPLPGAHLEEPPRRVDIWFDVPLMASPGAELVVTNEASGARVDRQGSPLDEADARHLGKVLAAPIDPGRYVVSWRAVTEDGDSVEGSYAFSVGNPGEEDDDRVLVGLATFGAAATAVVVGSAGYLLRRRLGLVKPPPAQGPEH